METKYISPKYLSPSIVIIFVIFAFFTSVILPSIESYFFDATKAGIGFYGIFILSFTSEIFLLKYILQNNYTPFSKTLTLYFFSNLAVVVLTIVGLKILGEDFTYYTYRGTSVLFLYFIPFAVWDIVLSVKIKKRDGSNATVIFKVFVCVLFLIGTAITHIWTLLLSAGFITPLY
jgi:hypothetical protein